MVLGLLKLDSNGLVPPNMETKSIKEKVELFDTLLTKYAGLSPDKLIVSIWKLHWMVGDFS